MNCFILPCFPQLQKHRSKQFYDFQSPDRSEASVLEVITSPKMQHVLHSYKHEAFQKVKYKLDLIGNHTLTKYILANDNCKRDLNTSRNLVFRYRIYHPKQSLTFLSCSSFSCSSTSYLAFHS